jgi:hypothetical protein
MSCKEKQKNFPEFYWQILKCWCEAKQINNIIESPIEIRRQCLWFNKEIKLNNKEIQWNEWHKKGINIIHDICNRDGTLLTSQEVELKFDIKCDFMKYTALKDVIPLEWRKKLKTMKVDENAISFKEQPHLKIGKQYKPIQLITNKDIYWSFVSKKQVKPVITESIQMEFGIENEKWEEIFMLPKVIQDTKIRTFQYKILFNLIPCNLYLKRIKRSDTDKCFNCNLLDDIAHYFYECRENRNFWNSFTKWWENITGNVVSINSKVTRLGYLEDDTKKDTLNACLLLAKWYIYRCRLDQSQPFLYKYLCNLRYHIIVEKLIAIQNNRLEKYIQMWQLVDDYLT